MKTRTVSKAKLKPHLLEYLREVHATGRELIITDRGRPVLKIVPYVDKPSDAIKRLRGSVIKYEEPLKPVPVEWTAQS